MNPQKGLFFFDSSYRPVPLAQQYIGISEHKFSARTELLNEICYKKVLPILRLLDNRNFSQLFGTLMCLSTLDQVVDSIKQGHQAMVFVHSRKDTAKTADKLVLPFMLA